jgi:hypothetical protein
VLNDFCAGDDVIGVERWTALAEMADMELDRAAFVPGSRVLDALWLNVKEVNADATFCECQAESALSATDIEDAARRTGQFLYQAAENLLSRSVCSRHVRCARLIPELFQIMGPNTLPDRVTSIIGKLHGATTKDGLIELTEGNSTTIEELCLQAGLGER